MLCVVAFGAAVAKQDRAHVAAPTSSASLTPRAAGGAPPWQPPSSGAAAPTPLGEIGQDVRDGKFAFVVTSVDSSKLRSLAAPTNPYMQQTAQGVFVNIHMRVTNIGDAPQTCFATNQKLESMGSQQFNADTMAAVWAGAATVEINPGNSIDTTVSFDVQPRDAALHGCAARLGFLRRREGVPETIGSVAVEHDRRRTRMTR